MLASHVFVQTCLFYQLVVVIGATQKHEECHYLLDYDFNECQSVSRSRLMPQPCRADNLCRENIRITTFNLIPFSVAMTSQLSEMLILCCGGCQTLNQMMNGTILGMNSTLRNASDILFPVYGKSAVNRLYGYWFIPFFDVPPGYYVIKRQTKKEKLQSVLTGIFAMWPLLCIILILALLAGFVVWILDTWSNPEEFPRPFLPGLINGFWWAYVSMTTVGYGDKATKSPAGRVFSVIWILIGITSFNMMTASLTNIITDASMFPSTDLTGKKVGVLKGRTYDATVAARHGAILRVTDYNDDIDSGITTLIDKVLSSDELDGFLVDKLTYHTYSFRNPDNKLNDTVFTQMEIATDIPSYGILVKHEAHYHYFSKYVANNWFQLETCRRAFINTNFKIPPQPDDGGLFSRSGGTFDQVLLWTLIVLGLFLIFGFFYDLKRKNRLRFWKSNQTEDLELAESTQ